MCDASNGGARTDDAPVDGGLGKHWPLVNGVAAEHPVPHVELLHVKYEPPVFSLLHTISYPARGDDGTTLHVLERPTTTDRLSDEVSLPGARKGSWRRA